jgi:hypothetical protein
MMMMKLDNHHLIWDQVVNDLLHQSGVSWVRIPSSSSSSCTETISQSTFATARCILHHLQHSNGNGSIQSDSNHHHDDLDNNDINTKQNIMKHTTMQNNPWSWNDISDSYSFCDQYHHYCCYCNALCPIQPNTDSAHVTGYHWAGCEMNDHNTQQHHCSLSRYNHYRRGFVWSDEAASGNPPPPPRQQQVLSTTTATCSNNPSCLDTSQDIQASPSSVSLPIGPLKEQWNTATTTMAILLHHIAEQVLVALERKLHLPLGWFQEHYGPTRTNSQWHIKEYVVIPTTNSLLSESTAAPVAASSGGDQHQYQVEEIWSNHQQQATAMWLPVHTDPSLISVLIHDVPMHLANSGAQGLQYYHQLSNDISPWHEIPLAGHGVAVILVGSVLHAVTGGYFPAAKHRVVHSGPLTMTESSITTRNNNNVSPSRMAATLFVRPAPTAKLMVPPSPFLRHVPTKRNVTFAEWNARVARNYQKNCKSIEGVTSSVNQPKKEIV